VRALQTVTHTLEECRKRLRLERRHLVAHFVARIPLQSFSIRADDRTVGLAGHVLAFVSTIKATTPANALLELSLIDLLDPSVLLTVRLDEFD
jgi:hypothetical protein